MLEQVSDEQRAAIRQKIKELDLTLTGDLNEDIATLAVIRNLKEKIGMYHAEFDETGCIYCSG
jgi:hypothetical protein